MDNTSWSQESGWLRLKSLAPGLTGDFMPSLGAYLLALGNLLCPLPWQVCSLSDQLDVGPGWGAGCGAGVGGGSSGAAGGKESFVANLRADFFPCPPDHGRLILLEAPLCQLLPCLLVDPCEPQESNSAADSDTGSCWRKGKQEGEEHVSVNKGVLSLVGTRCKAAFSPLGDDGGLAV